ncbi:THUMP domain-containing protein [Microthyrium microscopicum]|uniref:THUMP domain-containing protein n=1 Tax=Microthyrium microscopicum TaxID=703497 RepID=A0A6A6UJ40_9PEZI|nr:THUMP domain-containing protein [Microthyrium microscopicum]
MENSESRKRKAESSNGGSEAKKTKGKREWTVPRKGGDSKSKRQREPEAGDSGIWVSCDMQREGKCVSELRPLFEEHAQKLYSLGDQDGTKLDESKANRSVEDELAQELEELRDRKTQIFTSMRMGTPCLLFFKTSAPIDPVEFVLSFCNDAAAHPDRKQTRHAKRLTPITLFGKASEKGLEELAKKVLAPHFHGEDQVSKKFAIRANLRNHNQLKREEVIRRVAEIVGHLHTVDLKNYDLLILIDVYKNICGISVVTQEFETLKRFNLSEIHSPTQNSSSQVKAEPEVQPEVSAS